MSVVFRQSELEVKRVSEEDDCRRNDKESRVNERRVHYGGKAGKLLVNDGVNNCVHDKRH